MKYLNHHIAVLFLACILFSCSYSKKFASTYYQENDSLFQSINHRFKVLHAKHPFSVEMKDRQFRRIGLEIITDSIKYIYNFGIDEPRFRDTLLKYRFNVEAVTTLIRDMQTVHCTWITNLDYYENSQKKFLVFISIRHPRLKDFLRSEKYFTLAFFDRSQHFDDRGRLLDNQDRNTLHRINDGLFWKITDRVFYSLSASFR